MHTYRLFPLSALCMLSLIAPAKASIIDHVFLNPVDQSQTLGSQFSVELQAENFSQGLDGGSVDLTFNSSILRAVSVSINNSIWNFAALSGVIDNTAGNIIFTDFAQFGSNTVNNLLDIATFTFQSIGVGSSQLHLSVNNNDPFGANGDVVPVNLSDATVEVAPPVASQSVPIPDAFLWLLAVGLAGTAKITSRIKV
jgi:hypothetical protein